MKNLMDQKKIGRFLKELRSEKGLTQEQFAEELGVSNRSVSRWENGASMPDFDVLLQIADYFEVGIDEILDGRRKEKNLEKETEETLLKVADYSSSGNISFSKALNRLFLAAIAAFIVFMVIEVNGLASVEPYENIASYMLGLVGGALVVGVLYTSRYISKVKAFKMRILGRAYSAKK